MRYRDWTITAYPTFLGYSAHYVSPVGQAHDTSPYFASEEQAFSYVKTLIDNFLEVRRSEQPSLETAG